MARRGLTASPAIGKAEIEQLRVAFFRNQDIRRFQVAMHELELIGLRQRRRDLLSKAASHGNGQRPPPLHDVFQSGGADIP